MKNQKRTGSDLVTSGLRRYRGTWSGPEAAHLARRTLFGADPASVATLQKHSLKKAVKHLLRLPGDPDSQPLNAYNDDKYTDPEIPLGKTWINSQKFDGMNNPRRVASVKAWWIGQMVNQDCSLQEKMVLFWHNHFSTQARTIHQANLFYHHLMLLRTHSLGNFKDMVRAVTLDPYMLRYLNGASNTKKAPDENYGRELQELFTVGKGPQSRYSEDDVKAAARVLTGYTVDGKNFISKFEPGRHDEGDKRFSAFYKNRLILGRSGPRGAEELDEMLEMIFEQGEVAAFVCRKFYRFFVYHQIDAATEKNVIQPLATIFKKHDFEIRPVLEALFCSQHFFDPANRGACIKSPLDFTIGSCRMMRVRFPGSEEVQAQYRAWQVLHRQAAGMQQDLGDPPNVAGWPAYYQAPEFDKSWISSDSLPKRNQFTDRMLSGPALAKSEVRASLDILDWAGHCRQPADPDALIEEIAERILVLPLPEKEKATIKTSILLSGLEGPSADAYWKLAWQQWLSNPQDLANRYNLDKKLRALLRYLMQLPQYHLC